MSVIIVDEKVLAGIAGTLKAWNPDTDMEHTWVTLEELNVTNWRYRYECKYDDEIKYFFDNDGGKADLKLCHRFRKKPLRAAEIMALIKYLKYQCIEIMTDHPEDWFVRQATPLFESLEDLASRKMMLDILGEDYYRHDFLNSEYYNHDGPEVFILSEMV